MRLRTTFDYTSRGTVQGLRSTCGGLVALERAPSGPTGAPAGVVDPTGYSTRTALWIDNWMGADNPAGILMTAPIGQPPLADPLVFPWYTSIANAFSYEDLTGPCGSPIGSPLDGRPLVIAIAPEGSGGKIVWIGTSLSEFGGDDPTGIQDLMRAVADWVYE